MYESVGAVPIDAATGFNERGFNEKVDFPPIRVLALRSAIVSFFIWSRNLSKLPISPSGAPGMVCYVLCVLK